MIHEEDISLGISLGKVNVGGLIIEEDVTFAINNSYLVVLYEASECRIFIIPIESRAYTIPAESRVFTIACEQDLIRSNT
jgi:hypothetical protein